MRRHKVICSECSRIISAASNDPDEHYPMNHAAVGEDGVCRGRDVEGVPVDPQSAQPAETRREAV